MDEPNQLSHATKYNRYPEIFQIIAEYSRDSKEKRVLSFGCSDGQEVLSLRKIYFPKAHIHGIDIDRKLIEKVSERNHDPKIHYFFQKDQLIEESYDVIFVMSVLCRWPETVGEYLFVTFDQTLKDIDKYLKKNGYLVIYNSKYVFEEASIAWKYQKINTNYKDSGFVTKYSRTKQKLKQNYSCFLFKKVK